MLANDIEQILINHQQITQRCQELGEQIANDYQGKNPIVVGLLRGSVPFLAELTKNIDIPLEIDFMDVMSYQGTKSTGDVKIMKDLNSSIKDRHIIIVEDIVDTGKTLVTVMAYLYNKGAKDVKIVSMLDKKSRRIVDIDADYVGFDIPDCFVVGFGLDFNQKYRNLPYVGVLKKELYCEEVN